MGGICVRGGSVISKGDIEKAYAAIRDQVVRTPLVCSRKFSTLAGCGVLFKLENFQMTGSFKERGALWKLLSLGPEEKKRGVITASAGNHAQGVAYHAQRLGIRAQIVMPVGTPLVKVVSTQSYGAEVLLHGETYDEASELAAELSGREGAIYVHPFDDPLVAAGQGTIALEVLEEELARGLEAVLCPVGGGGLISGISVYLKETLPGIEVIGVEAADCPKMKLSLEAGRPVRLESASSLADGIALKRVGEINFQIVQRYVDRVVTVEEDEIANAILRLLESEKIMVEGAGAVPLAALLHRKVELPGKKVLAIVSGGNIDVHILNRIIARGLAVEGRIAQVRLRLKDRPGALASVLEIIRARRVNILEIVHHRFDTAAPFGSVDVSLTLETRGQAQIEEIQRELLEAGHLLVGKT